MGAPKPAAAPGLAQLLPQPVTEAEVLSVDIGGSGERTRQQRWLDDPLELAGEGGRQVIVHAEPAG
jgi:hypothetical protein